ncbi:MAG: ferrous iron transport protein B [Thermodesulfobacteriota bacterium]|nr:ferrous iron transport protein B [Thermodesulfobacteriota bacterium]
MNKKKLTIALAGNPNAGKTTIFNHLTGTRQKVGNWSGVTVEKKTGVITRGNYAIDVVDLPGTYSLTPFSIEEIIARNFIIDEAPDVVINIIDSSNLERSLYLATQVRELDCKVLFVLNMADIAGARGIKIDADKLSDLLSVDVVFTVGNKNEGVDALLDRTIRLAESEGITQAERRVRYNREVEAAIGELREMLDARPELFYNSRWLSIKLLENDKIVRDRVQKAFGEHAGPILEKTAACRSRLMDIFDDDPEIIMTDERYGFIAGLIKEVVSVSGVNRVDISRNIDMVLTDKYLGFPVFVFFIWLMFQLTFTLGAYPMGWIEEGVALVITATETLLPPGLFRDMLVDGAIAGVGSVAVFLPNILILFFCIALFEDTGYMARAAFLMDRIMHLIGLHGKSFIPMLMGFGCSVPAVMATRTIENRKDRLLTIMITPFMSCSARLPVYIVLAGTFFPKNAGTVIFLIYLLGIVMAIVTGRLFRSSLLRGADAPFVMELPPYRVPMAKSLMIHMWDRAKIFLKKMGGVIFVGSIIVWALSTFPRDVAYSEDYAAKMAAASDRYEQQIARAESREERAVLEERKSEVLEALRTEKEQERARRVYMGRIGTFIAPVFEPIGIDWRGSVALLTGFVAKEIVVSSMGVLYAVDDGGTNELKKAIKSSGMTALSALSMMVFVLLYVPCVATVATIMRETKSGRWTLFNVVYATALAWCVAFVVYRGGMLLTAGNFCSMG